MPLSKSRDRVRKRRERVREKLLGTPQAHAFGRLRRDRDAYRAHLAWYQEAQLNPSAGLLILQVKDQVNALTKSFIQHEANHIVQETSGTYSIK